MQKLKLSFFDKIVLLGAVVFSIGLLLSGWASHFDPREYIYISFLGLAYPFLLMGNLALLLYWIFRAKWGIGFATLVFVALGWPSLKATYNINFFGNEGDNRKSKEEYLRLMTYNVHQFKLFGYDNDKYTKNKILKVIASQRPDVVCFQEFYTRYKGNFDIADSIKKKLNLYYYYFEPSAKNDYEAYGLAIFSRYPIKNKGLILFNDSLRGNESIFADIMVKGKLLRVYNVHFQSISFEKQDYDYIDRMAHKKKPEFKSSKRIVSMIKYAFEKRAEQVDIMKEKLQNTAMPYIIAGDFNDTPGSYTVAQITKGLRNAFIEKGRGFGKTYNGKFPNFQIDYIACTAQLEVVNYYINAAKLSDHFPVRSDLKMNF